MPYDDESLEAVSAKAGGTCRYCGNCRATHTEHPEAFGRSFGEEYKVVQPPRLEWIDL